MQETLIIGIALRALRESAGMTLEQVADTAGASISYLSRAENGQVAPTPAWIQTVVAAIGSHIAEKSAA